jgi:para-nitrobenzyl esterase
MCHLLIRLCRAGIILCFMIFSTLISNGQGDIVQTESGTISGKYDSQSGVYSFKGVPFAAPPLGNLRWREPQPVKPWSGVLKCDTFKASAMQMTPNPNPPWSAEFMAPLKPISEDCLYLNVWTSKNEPGKKKPVIVWIHGGAFTGGSGSVALYDGTAMAQQGVVFVTINYRLGIFGFLAHPALSAESPHHVSGNYGIFD